MLTSRDVLAKTLAKSQKITFSSKKKIPLDVFFWLTTEDALTSSSACNSFFFPLKIIIKKCYYKNLFAFDFVRRNDVKVNYSTNLTRIERKS